MVKKVIRDLLPMHTDHYGDPDRKQVEEQRLRQDSYIIRMDYALNCHGLAYMPVTASGSRPLATGDSD